MTEPLSILSPEKANSFSAPADEDDMTWHDPPSSPFISHVENDQENVAPADLSAPTPLKPLINFEEDNPQSAFKMASPSKTFGLKERSPVKMASAKQLLDDYEESSPRKTVESRRSPKKSSPVKQIVMERPESAMSDRSRTDFSPIKYSRPGSVEPAEFPTESIQFHSTAEFMSPVKRPSSSHKEPALRDNEGLTVAMQFMEETRSETHSETYESTTSYHVENGMPDMDDHPEMDDTDFNPDGPDLTSVTIDDTCFSALDMTKFAFLKKSPTKNGLTDQATPRARPHMTPSTVRRNERTPSPTPRRPRKDNAGDTTTMLLDFTAQIEAFSALQQGTQTRTRHSPTKSTTEPNLLSYIQNQRSPTKGASGAPLTPSRQRQVFNLLDFELPPPPTPRSIPTVTIRELESLKSTFQSQISSLTASLSGKEAEVDSLVKAVSNAERRVGEAQELLREERSAREHAESQMVDWKNKGEEVQKLLQDVQSELARNDSERESLLARLVEAEKRAEDAEQRSTELETKVIEVENKNVDMTTFINNGEGEDEDNKKIYSENECQAAIAERVNEVARDLHTAYKAKHEKKIKALRENYQKKGDERCKELRVQIIRLERQVEEAEKKRGDDTFSKVLPVELPKADGPCAECTKKAESKAELTQQLDAMKANVQNLKAKLAGLESELSSMRKSQDSLLQELESERVEKGELVAAAEQMLALCGEKMEEMQQEELRKSQMGVRPPTEPMRAGPGRPGSALGGGRPTSAMGERLGAMGAEKATGIAKPSGLRAPGGFGFQGGSAGAGAAPGLSRSTSGSKSRLMSNIERMGGRGME